MNKKCIGTSIICFILLIVSMFALSACSGNGHTHNYSTEWAKDGLYHWQACSGCEETRRRSEHDWNSGVVTVQPTTTSEGARTYTCNTCGHTRAESIPVLDTHEHAFSESWSSNETHHWHEATCEHTTEKKNYGEHEWNNGVITTMPTTTSKGAKTFTCETCDNTKIEYIQELEEGHSHVYNQQNTDDDYINSDATCIEKATYFYSCSCGEKGNIIFESGSFAEHEYTSLEYSEAEHWYECSCGAYETKENHIPGTAATETMDQKCTECEYVITPAIGHVHTLLLTKVDAKAQSCTEEGNIEYYICSCNKWFADSTATTEITNKDSVVIEKDEHNHAELKNDEAEHWYECVCGDKSGIEEHKGGTATCIEKAICSVCSIEYGELMPHNAKQQWKSDDTYHWYECETNGCSYQCNKTTHVLNSNKKCTICDYVSSQYLFTIIWKNYDGEILEEDKNVLYGTVPTYDGETPIKEKDKQYTYVFSGWAPNIIGATENVTYTAQFNSTTNKYKVQFVDHDGTVLEEQDVEYGQSATLPIDPYREGYRFIGWTGSHENIIDDVTIEANYVRQFTVQFVDYDNSIIDIQLVDIGQHAIRPQDPIRNNYRFLDWDKAFNNVASDLTVKALYVRLYKVEFIDWDGTVLEEQIVEHAQSATSPKKNPNRTGYTFVSWNQDYTAVVSNMQIVAVYEINRYIATFVMPDGVVIETKDKIAHGTTISSPKVEDMYFDWSKTKGYRFTGWKDWDESHPIESNITIIANYSQEITEPIIAIETREISKGTTTAEVSIYLCGSFESIYGISLKFEYAEQLVLSSGSIVVNSKLEGAEGTLKTDKNQYELSWVNGQGLNITERLEIVTLTFNIDKYTEIGEYMMSLFDGTYIIDGSYVKITPILVIGQVVVTE